MLEQFRLAEQKRIPLDSIRNLQRVRQPWRSVSGLLGPLTFALSISCRFACSFPSASLFRFFLSSR
jgi:hypothetical protein